MEDPNSPKSGATGVVSIRKSGRFHQHFQITRGAAQVAAYLHLYQ